LLVVFLLGMAGTDGDGLMAFADDACGHVQWSLPNGGEGFRPAARREHSPSPREMHGTASLPPAHGHMPLPTWAWPGHCLGRPAAGLSPCWSSPTTAPRAPPVSI